MTEKKDDKLWERSGKDTEQTPKQSKAVKYTIATVGFVVVGLGSLTLGSYVGNQLGTTNDNLDIEHVDEQNGDSDSEEVTSIMDEEESDAVVPTQVEGQPKYDPETIIDRDVAPWNDGYVQDDTYLEYLTIEEFEEKVDSGERFVIYVGRATCPFCHTYRQVQDPALELLGETIYSIDTEFYRDNETLASLRERLNNQYVPEVLLIEDGESLQALPDDYDEMGVEELAEWLDGLIN